MATTTKNTQDTTAIEKVILYEVNGLVFKDKQQALEYKQALYEK